MNIEDFEQTSMTVLHSIWLSSSYSHRRLYELREQITTVPNDQSPIIICPTCVLHTGFFHTINFWYLVWETFTVLSIYCMFCTRLRTSCTLALCSSVCCTTIVRDIPWSKWPFVPTHTSNTGMTNALDFFVLHFKHVFRAIFTNNKCKLFHLYPFPFCPFPNGRLAYHCCLASVNMYRVSLLGCD